MRKENGINWTISSNDWNSFPAWKKDQLKQDRKIGLNRYYKILNQVSDYSQLTELVYQFNFTKPLLLVNTPLDWILPEPYKFNVRRDIEKLIYKVGESYPLFKFVNRNGNIPYYDFTNNNYNKFMNINIQMQITLISNESSTNEICKEIKLVLPTIEVEYSNFIFHCKYPDDGNHSAFYYQNVYFPLMVALGYADLSKYEAYEDKFYREHNQVWDYLTINVKYNY